MALSADEIVRRDTLDILTEITHSPYPIGYARIDSWRIHYGDPSFNAHILLYYNEDARKKNPQNFTQYEIGSHLNQTMLNLFQNGDDRIPIYKAVEYLIHYSYYEKLFKEMPEGLEREAYIAEKSAILDELDDNLGIDLSTFFILGKQN